MAAPTNLACKKKTLVRPEPSIRGPNPRAPSLETFGRRPAQPADMINGRHPKHFTFADPETEARWSPGSGEKRPTARLNVTSVVQSKAAAGRAKLGSVS